MRWKTDNKKGYGDKEIFDLEDIRTPIVVGFNLGSTGVSCIPSRIAIGAFYLLLCSTTRRNPHRNAKEP